MRRIPLLLIILAIFAGNSTAGEQPPLPEFDGHLKAALAQKNPAAVAMLVHFPLRVNYPDGSSISLNNAQAIASRFSEIFPPKVCSAVLEQKEPERMGDRGMMYGNGILWIKQIQLPEDPGQTYYGIETVNLPEAGKPGAKLEFTCDTGRHRIVIDSDASGCLRYRSWNKPHFISDRPDMEISSGVRDMTGTGPCSGTRWTFKKGDTEFVMNECGLCGCEASDTTGTLSVSIAGKIKQTRECY